MTVNSIFELHKALYSALTEDSELMALVEGVYNHVPQGSAFPYVVIGASSGADWSSKTTAGVQVQPVISVFSRERGMQQALAITAHIKEILQDTSLSLTGCNLVLFRFLSSTIQRLPDGLTYHGTMTFNALIEE